MVENNFLDLESGSVDAGSGSIPVAPEQVHRVKDLCTTWSRAVKTICLYPSSNPLPGEFRTKFFDAVTRMVEDDGRLMLTANDHGFEFQGHTVYEAEQCEENLAFVLFRDGIREVAFDPGVTRDESDRFLDLLAGAFTAGGTEIDVANLLWEEGFLHIHHKTVDRIVEGSYIEITDSHKLDEIHERFVAGGAGGEPDTPYRGVQQERYEQACSTFGGTASLSPQELQQLVTLNQACSDIVTEHLGLGILTEIVRGSSESRIVDETLAVMEKQLDAWTKAGRWDLAGSLLEDWHTLSDDATPHVRQRIQSAVSRASSAQNFAQLATYLNANPQADLEQIQAIFTQLGRTGISGVTSILGLLEHRPARMMVCKHLSSLGQDAVDLIGAFIYDKRWFVVRNVAMILGQIGQVRALTFLRKSAKHTDPRVRLESLRSVQRYPGGDAERIMLGFLDDDVADVRKRALRALTSARSSAAVPYLRKQVESGSLTGKDPAELRELFIAYASLGGEEAASRLLRLATRARWFGGAGSPVVRQAAVFGLGASSVARARAELEILARKRRGMIGQAAQAALSRRRLENTRPETWYTPTPPEGGSDDA